MFTFGKLCAKQPGIMVFRTMGITINARLVSINRPPSTDTPTHNFNLQTNKLDTKTLHISVSICLLPSALPTLLSRTSRLQLLTPLVCLPSYPKFSYPNTSQRSSELSSSSIRLRSREYLSSSIRHLPTRRRGSLSIRIRILPRRLQLLNNLAPPSRPICHPSMPPPR